MTCTGVQLSGACQTFARSASETRCMARALVIMMITMILILLE